MKDLKYAKHPRYSKLSVLIPVYNEEKTLRSILDRINKISLKDLGLEKEIVFVNDCSTDQTSLILKEIMEENRKGNTKRKSSMKDNTNDQIVVVHHKKNAGKGSAIRTALEHASGDIVLIQDADLEYDPKDYPALLKPIVSGRASVVYGSRILKKSNQRHSGVSFYLGGLGITFTTNLLYDTKITDEPTCYKVFRTDLIKSLRLKCKGFEFCPEVTAKIAKKGIKIHEVPISYYPRSKTEGKKINWRDGFSAIWWLFKLRFFD